MEKLPFILRENPDGSIVVNYEDLDIEFFGGGDYEVNYSLDAANADKLRKKLAETYTGDLKQMITEEFGICLDKKSFSKACNEWGIEYSLFTI